MHIDGESYRMRTHRARAERLTKGVGSDGLHWPHCDGLIWPHPGEHLGNFDDREWGISLIGVRFSPKVA